MAHGLQLFPIGDSIAGWLRGGSIDQKASQLYAALLPVAQLHGLTQAKQFGKSYRWRLSSFSENGRGRSDVAFSFLAQKRKEAFEYFLIEITGASEVLGAGLGVHPLSFILSSAIRLIGSHGTT